MVRLLNNILKSKIWYCILKYVHRYIAMYCLFLGYFVFSSLYLCPEWLDALKEVALIIFIIVIIISVFTNKATEDKIMANFGLRWVK